MMNAAALDALKQEITTDPVGRGYRGKTPEEITDLINGPWAALGPKVKSPASLTPSEFFARFTPDEAVAIRDAAGVNKFVYVYWEQLLLAQGKIDLSDVRIQQGMGLLASAGLISPSRVPVILAAPPDIQMPDVEMHPRVLDIFMGIEGAPNAVAVDDVKAVI